MKEKQIAIIENYIISYNSFDVDGMLKDLSNEILFENISKGKIDLTTNGIKEFRKQAELAKDYFIKREQIIKSWQFDDNLITVKIAYKGLLSVDLPNGLKKGDLLELIGQTVFEFKEGKISRITDKS